MYAYHSVCVEGMCVTAYTRCVRITTYVHLEGMSVTACVHVENINAYHSIRVDDVCCVHNPLHEAHSGIIGAIYMSLFLNLAICSGSHGNRVLSLRAE